MLRFSFLAVIAASAALSACGKAETKTGKEIVIDKSIYMSGADCADAGKLKADVCSILIDRAVKMHESQAVTFKSLRSCEDDVGIDRCEKTPQGLYRMRLQAFMFEIGGPQPQAMPLYPSAEGKIGFRDAQKKLVDGRDDNINVSQASLTLAHENSKLSTKKRR